MGKDEKVLKVLSEIIKGLLESKDEDIKVAELKLMERLIEKGYDIDEISDALEEIFEMMNISEREQFKLRVIQKEELSNLTEEAKEYIFFLRNSGQLDELDFERVLAISGVKEEIVDKTIIEEIVNENCSTFDKKIN